MKPLFLTLGMVLSAAYSVNSLASPYYSDIETTDARHTLNVDDSRNATTYSHGVTYTFNSDRGDGFLVSASTRLSCGPAPDCSASASAEVSAHLEVSASLDGNAPLEALDSPIPLLIHGGAGAQPNNGDADASLSFLGSAGNYHYGVGEGSIGTYSLLDLDDILNIDFLASASSSILASDGDPPRIYEGAGAGIELRIQIDPTWEYYEYYSLTFSRDWIGHSTLITPIPASVWLFGSGLIGLVGMARRKKIQSD